MKKKILIVAAVVLIIFGFTAGCSTDTGGSESSSSAAETPTETTEAPAETPAETPPSPAEEAVTGTVLYQVESDGAAATSITYSTMDNGNIGQSQANGAPVPFATEVAVEGEGQMFAMNSYSLIAQADETATTITCRITVNGEVRAEQTSTGAFAVVTCTG